MRTEWRPVSFPERRMIQQLREQSQSIFFKLLLGFIAITFVISFGVGSFFGNQKDVIALVNSKELLAQEYQRFYSQQLDSLRSRFGANADQLAEQLNLRQQVLQQLINRHLLADEAKKQGLQITDFELADHIKGLPYFQINGHFDDATYRQVLAQNRMLVEEYEKELRVDLLANKYRNTLLAGVVVSDAEVDQKYRNENETITLDYVYFDPVAFTDQVHYTAEDLQKYYQEHSKDFEKPKQFKIEYFILTLDHFKQTATVKEREVVRYYERNQEDYLTPAEVKARHILIKTTSAMSAEEKAEKRKQIEGLLVQLKEGADFEALAKAHSEDFSKEQGGDLGWFKPGEMVAGFEEAAFDLEPSQLSDVVESPFGFHIIRVDEKKPETIQSLEEARAAIEEVLKEARAEKKLNLEFDRLEKRMQAENDLAAIAKSFDTTSAQTDFFDQESSVEGLGSEQQLVNQMDSFKIGDYGRLKRNPLQGYVFYKLLETEAPAIQPFEQVKSEVIPLVKTQKATVLASEIAQKEANTLTSETSLAAIAEKHNLTIEETSLTAASSAIEGIGADPEFKKKALALNETQRIGRSQYQGKVYLLALKSRELPKNEDVVAQKGAIRSRLIEQLRSTFGDKDMERLRATASIEILNPFFNNANTPGS